MVTKHGAAAALARQHVDDQEILQQELRQKYGAGLCPPELWLKYSEDIGCAVSIWMPANNLPQRLWMPLGPSTTPEELKWNISQSHDCTIPIPKGVVLRKREDRKILVPGLALSEQGIKDMDELLLDVYYVRGEQDHVVDVADMRDSQYNVDTTLSRWEEFESDHGQRTRAQVAEALRHTDGHIGKALDHLKHKIIPEEEMDQKIEDEEREMGRCNSRQFCEHGLLECSETQQWGFFCELCEKTFLKGTAMHGCSQCNVWLCVPCFDDGKRSTSSPTRQISSQGDEAAA